MTEKQYPKLPDPTAWRSYDNLLKRARYDAVPITSTQPGIYSHTRMFTEDQTRAFADATCAMRATKAEPVQQPKSHSKLFCDLKTDEEKSNFFLSGKGYETGVIAAAIQNDVAMAYHRCAEYKKAFARQPERVPLTEAQLKQIHHIEEFGLFCDYSEFEQIARAIELVHGIKPKEQSND